MSNVRYIMYARKSSEEEDRQVQSIVDQNAALSRLADASLITIVDKLEESCSAKEPGARPIFAALLRRIRDGEADGILCWSTNRLFRNPVDAGEVQWLLQRGVLKSIRTVEREYRPEDNVLLLAVEAATANQYVIDLSKNVKRGLNEKARRGWWPTKAKAGYVTVTKPTDGAIARVIEPDPDRFALLRRAWEKMLTGVYTVPQVLDMLNSWGYHSAPNRKGLSRPMSRSGLYRLFQDPFYAGRFWFGTEWHVGRHQVMVTDDEFRRVQQVLGRPGKPRPKRQEFAFSGMIRCGVCGCMVTVERKVKVYRTTGRRAEYVYYRCTGNRGCSKAGVREEYIANEIRNLLLRWQLDQEIVRLFEEEVDYTVSEVEPGAKLVARQRTTALKRVERRLDVLYSMREDGEISAEEFIERKRRLRAESAQINGRMTEDSERLHRNARAVRNGLRFLNDSLELFDSGSVRGRREVASLLADSYVLTLGTLTAKPDPMLAMLGAFEPPTVGPDMVGTITCRFSRPGMRGARDAIRNLLTGSPLCFEYETSPKDEKS